MKAPIRVLVVDDSAVVRQVLTAVLEKDPDIEVIGAVPDPLFAMERMKREWPDVVVADVEMPRMDGITFLRRIMAVRPTPVVVCSTLTAKGAQTTMDALSAGAVAIVTKPSTGLREFLAQDDSDIVHAVKTAAAGDMRKLKAQSMAMSAPAARLGAARPAVPVPRGTALSETTDKIVAIGASTGGTQALEFVLTRLPRTVPGLLVVQHMPETFTAAFAERLNQLSECEVLEASVGDRVIPGRILIAPGGRHMTVARDGAQYRVGLNDGERVNRFKPSVDVLFDSVSRAAGANALGIIMTGMGDDGARGLLAIRSAGGRTAGQDEATSIVYGMPAAAKEIGAVEREIALADIAHLIQNYGQRG